ncbi:unnamed protein product [Symbiodinium sp. CCMP2592]|nr:unnamed protein product [Symbiodinium sp. CCMP2592]
MDQSIVLNLMQLGAPKVLLLRWISSLTFEPRFQLFDIFCGEGNMGKTWAAEGYSVASYDKLRGPQMDFTSNGGFEMVLLILVMLAKQTTFVVEQPTGLLRVGLCKAYRVSEVFTCNFWMHVDKAGKKRFTGSNENLKKSGIFTVEFAKNMLSAYKEWIPDSWLEAMQKFHEEVRCNVSWVHPISTKCPSALELDSYKMHAPSKPDVINTPAITLGTLKPYPILPDLLRTDRITETSLHHTRQPNPATWIYIYAYKHSTYVC